MSAGESRRPKAGCFASRSSRPLAGLKRSPQKLSSALRALSRLQLVIFTMLRLQFHFILSYISFIVQCASPLCIYNLQYRSHQRSGLKMKTKNKEASPFAFKFQFVVFRFIFVVFLFSIVNLSAKSINFIFLPTWNDFLGNTNCAPFCPVFKSPKFLFVCSSTMIY